ncbi:MAG TPA: c-type cytochrome [Acidimicrobiales bacterium]
MTEIPEHLLERSRARRAALGLGGGESGAAPAAATPAAESAPAETKAAAAPAKAAAAAPVEAAKKPEVELSPYAKAAIARKKIPFWAVPVLLFLPLWGFLYWGTLDPATEEAAGLAAEGEAVYASCASCHGASGGGGAGPELMTVTQTFPDFQSHVWWVANGSDAVTPGSGYGSPDREGGQRVSAGGMPAWGDSLTARELLAVVYYERQHFGGATEEELAALEAIADNPELPENFGTGTTLDEITELLNGLTPAELATGSAAAE